MKINWLEKILNEKPIAETLDEVCVNFDPVLSDDMISLLSETVPFRDARAQETSALELAEQCTLDEYEQALQ